MPIYWHTGTPERIASTGPPDLDEGIDTQTQRQSLAGVQLHQRFQDLGVNAFARFVGANVFSAEDSANANNVTGEFLVAVGLGGNESGLAQTETGDVGFIDIETNA